jgi:hypothetical protein
LNGKCLKANSIKVYPYPSINAAPALVFPGQPGGADLIVTGAQLQRAASETSTASVIFAETGGLLRLMNRHRRRERFLVEMAGKEPANVVSSVMARQASADRGGGAAHALTKPGVIVNRFIGLETRI